MRSKFRGFDGMFWSFTIVSGKWKWRSALPLSRTVADHRCLSGLLQTRRGCNRRHTSRSSGRPFRTWDREDCRWGWLWLPRNSSEENRREETLYHDLGKNRKSMSSNYRIPWTHSYVQYIYFKQTDVWRIIFFFFLKAPFYKARKF
jgi:hypothetical protein